MAGPELQKRSFKSRSARRRHMLLLACAISALPDMRPAQAQPAAAAQGDAVQISVPAGPLTSALNQLAAQTGLEILFDAELTRGRTTRGVAGSYTRAQALDAVLAGTGIAARFAGTRQVMLNSSPTPGGEVTDGVFDLGEITIYGARDAMTLGSTSASVGIVTAEEISYSQIQTFRDAFRMLGNVMDADWNDAGFVIRGLSSEGFVPGGAPLASLYIDGVLQTQNGTRRGARGLWDVEQFEVYRGPQSTLSGRAAMAGSLYIKTKDPTFDQQIELSGTLGNFNLYDSAFMINTPLRDGNAALRIAGEFRQSKTDINYPTFAIYNRYDDLTTDLYYNLRGKLLFAPESSDTRALLSYSFAHDAPTQNDIGGPGYGFAFSEKRGDFNIPTYIEARSADTSNAGLEVTHDFSDALKLTMLTGFTQNATHRPSVNEGTPGQVNVVNGEQTDTLATQEFRLNYEFERWKWVAGLYGSYENYDTTFYRTINNNRNDRQWLSEYTTNLAAFGEVTYEFVPTWRLTAGGRLDYTNQDSEYINLRTMPLGSTPYISASYQTGIEELNFIPKIGISKEFGSDQIGGFTYSEGFRTGGYGLNNSTNLPYTYEPEHARNYELFYKGKFLDGRLTINANLFYTQYRNQQVEMRLNPSDPYDREITNAASSRSYGFEFEPRFQVNTNLMIFASVGWLNTKFEEFDQYNYGDMSGKPFPEAPEWTIAFGGRYVFDNGFYVSADAKYTSSYMARFGSAPQDWLEARTIVNMQGGYRTKNWELNLYVENLFNEWYYTYNDNDYAATLGPRRSFGANAVVRF